MLTPKTRNVLISVFVVLWLTAFHYESLRYAYLNPLIGRELPKIKFLFPPAGWIMFFQVGPQNVQAEVYGQKGGKLELIDPHKIFNPRWIGYDNIRRNILVSVLHPTHAPAFGQYLRRKFPEYEEFIVAQVIYTGNKADRRGVYKC